MRGFCSELGQVGSVAKHGIFSLHARCHDGVMRRWLWKALPAGLQPSSDQLRAFHPHPPPEKFARRLLHAAYSGTPREQGRHTRTALARPGQAAWPVSCWPRAGLMLALPRANNADIKRDPAGWRRPAHLAKEPKELIDRPNPRLPISTNTDRTKQTSAFLASQLTRITGLACWVHRSMHA